MKNEIKEGEYVRTKKGIIYKAEQTYYLNNNIPIKFATFSDRVTKHSSNIIDLIEEDDSIRIIDDYDDEIIIHIDSKNLHDRVKRRLESETWKLKSIVTKEQFKSIEYNI